MNIGISDALPFMSPDVSKLQFLGEGMEHLVLGLPELGKVLRIRKTEIGATTNYNDLLKKVQLDLDFELSIVDPLLGPLITNPNSVIVLLDPNKHKEIMTSISNSRQDARKNKQLNPYGIAVLCTNACTTFCDRPYTKQSSIINKSLKTEAINPEKICSSNSSKDIESSYSSSIKPPLRIEEENIMQQDINQSPKTVCVELKLKQSFLELSPSGRLICKFCIKQHLKVDNGKESCRSNFCPLDVFSGDSIKMKKGIDNLFLNPKTNLKVFLNSQPYKGDLKKFYYLKEVILKIITRPLETSPEQVESNEELYLDKDKSIHRNNKHVYGPESLLGKLLCLQKFDDLGIAKASDLYRQLVEYYGSNKKVDEQLENITTWKDNLYLMKSKLQLIKNAAYCNYSGNYYFTSDNAMNLTFKPKDGHNLQCSKRLKVLKSNHINVLNDKESALFLESSNDFNIIHIQDTIRKLQEYLLAMTVKDVSMMILIDGPYNKEYVENLLQTDKSPFWISINEDWFKCKITLVDLIMKPAKKILEHELMLDKMEDTLINLAKSHLEPTCCKNLI